MAGNNLEQVLIKRDVIEIPGTKIKVTVESLHPSKVKDLELLKVIPSDNKAATISHYTEMYIRQSVKKIEGFSFRGEEWDVEFEDANDKIITIESYAVLDLLFTYKVSCDFLDMILKFNDAARQELMDGMDIGDNSKKKEPSVKKKSPTKA